MTKKTTPIDEENHAKKRHEMTKKITYLTKNLFIFSLIENFAYICN